MNDKQFIATVRAAEAFQDLYNAFIIASDSFNDLVEATPYRDEDFQTFREVADNLNSWLDSLGDFADDLFAHGNTCMDDVMHDWEADTTRSLAMVEYDADTILANHISDLC